jgi:hypothetical protein
MVQPKPKKTVAFEKIDAIFPSYLITSAVDCF